jgi:DNA-binding GntR family transcriptional regulator
MLTLAPVRHPTLVDQVVEHVYERIIRGDLQCGQRVTEDDLAAEFGVSRTPVREAVKRLAELGVVVSYARTRLEVARIAPDDIRQIVQLRSDLECLALRYGMPRITEEDVDRLATLERGCRRLAQSGNRGPTFLADSEFHLAIASLSGNAYLLDALRRLDVKVQLCRAALCQSGENIRSNVQHHRHILKAIRQRDVKRASAAMRRHIHAMLSNV